MGKRCSIAMHYRSRWCLENVQRNILCLLLFLLCLCHRLFHDFIDSFLPTFACLGLLLGAAEFMLRLLLITSIFYLLQCFRLEFQATSSSFCGLLHWKTAHFSDSLLKQASLSPRREVGKKEQCISFSVLQVRKKSLKMKNAERESIGLQIRIIYSKIERRWSEDEWVQTNQNPSQAS